MKRIAALTLFLAALGYGQTPTLTLAGPATVRPGETITVNVNATLAAPPSSLAATQWSITVPAGYIASAVAGAASTAAGKTLYCNDASTTCLTVGINTNVYAVGVVAVYTLTIPSSAAPGMVTIPLSGVVGATLAGDAAALTAGAAYSFTILAPTDLNGDGKTDVQDLQIIVQQILTAGATVTVRDAQIIARAAVGGTASTGIDPHEIADWRAVSPNEILPADSPYRRPGTPLHDIRLGQGWIEAWRESATAYDYYRVAVVAGHPNPVLIGCRKDCGPQTFSWWWADSPIGYGCQGRWPLWYGTEL